VRNVRLLPWPGGAPAVAHGVSIAGRTYHGRLTGCTLGAADNLAVIYIHPGARSGGIISDCTIVNRENATWPYDIECYGTGDWRIDDIRGTTEARIYRSSGTRQPVVRTGDDASFEGLGAIITKRQRPLYSGDLAIRHGQGPLPKALDSYGWRVHCRGLYATPIAA
jgi:hypothetical protein